MDKRNFFTIDPAASDSKLTRASSFSDLLTSKKVTVEERYHSQTSGNLIKQYSCEAIFDDQTKQSRYTVSQFVTSDKQERPNIWKKKVADYNVKSSGWPNQIGKSSYHQEDLSLPVQRLSITGMDNTSSRKILAPPKLIFDDIESTQSLSNSQNSQNSFTRSSSSNLSRYESCEGSFSFKRPLTSIKRFNSFKEPNFIKDEKVESDVARKKYSPDTTSTDCTENEENEKYDVKRLKKRLRSLVAPTEFESKKKSSFCKCWVIGSMILLPIAVLCLAVILKDENIFNKLCDPHIKMNNIPEELSKRVHGQSKAIDELVKFFAQIENKVGFHILALIGGIGVGKSHTSEIIRSNLKESSQILDFFPPLYAEENRADSSLSLCQCNLIRLENLKSDDITDAVKFASRLKERSKNYCILILAVFNPEVIDHNLKRFLDLDKSTALIKSKFEEAQLKPTIVNYVTLNDEALNKCIEDLADYANVELTADEVEKIKKDLTDAGSGCKGAYAKIQITGSAARKASSSSSLQR